MWIRVFGSQRTTVSPAELTTHLHEHGLPVTPHFKGDDLGWTMGELVLPGGGTSVQLSRFLTVEDDLRGDLNAFAAELETMDFSPNNGDLMRRVIQTGQLIAIRRPLDHADEAALDHLCQLTARYLAQRTEGIFQIEGQGWFDTDGTMLLQEY